MRRFWKLATRSRKAKVVSVLAVFALMASSAFGAWIVLTYNGSGSGNAGGKFETVTQQPTTITFTVTASPNDATPVAPGQDGAVAFKLTNPSPQTFHITNITAGLPVITGDTCSAPDRDAIAASLSFNFSANYSVPNSVIGANQVDKLVGGTAHTDLAPSNPVAPCASGASFTVPVTVTATNP